MSQKILQPGDIGEHQPFPNVVLPNDPELFANRARRFRHLSNGHAMNQLLDVLGQLAHVANLAPGLAAGVEGADHHVGVPRQALQHAQVVRRQRTDAEHQQALLQALDDGIASTYQWFTERLDGQGEGGLTSIAVTPPS